MKDAFIDAIGSFAALFLIVNGSLLLFWPRHFLRFYDFWNRGDYIGRNAAWRKDVHTTEYKLLGVAFVVGGAVIIWGVARSSGWLG